MTAASSQDVTRLLQAWGDGDEGALEELVPIIHAELHRLAKHYLKRERRKPVPEGVDFWDFDCKVGVNAEEPVAKHPGDLEKAIEEAQLAGSSEVYVEILAKPGHRAKKPAIGESTDPGV